MNGNNKNPMNPNKQAEQGNRPQNPQQGNRPQNPQQGNRPQNQQQPQKPQGKMCSHNEDCCCGDCSNCKC